jgi:hypothetical protein
MTLDETYDGPPPLDIDALEPPPEIDTEYDYRLEPEPYMPTDWPDPPEWPDHEPDASWAWHDARLIGVDRGDGPDRYEIGAIDLYADAATGDLGGSYLRIAAFSDEGPAVGYYNALQKGLHEAGDDVAGYAEAQARTMGAQPDGWRGAGPAEYAAYEYLRDLETPPLLDDPPDDAIDPLIQTAVELGGVVVEPEGPTADEALAAIGVSAEGFDPATNPPPFVDEATGTAYWIGVFQPDKDDRENCVTSILSLGRDPETGAMEAQLAPCVPGDWDKAYGAADYLIDVAGRNGIEGVFDAAEGMALATDQRAMWETERGVPLDPDAAQGIAERWEVDR